MEEHNENVGMDESMMNSMEGRLENLSCFVLFSYT